MKKNVYIIFLLLIISLISINQLPAQGLERFKNYKFSFYVDNFKVRDSMDLDISPLPQELMKYYYSELIDNSTKMCKKKYAIKSFSQVFDTINHEHKLRMYTYKAKSGYLQINKDLSTYIEKKGLTPKKIKVLFFLDGNPVISRATVLKLICLKKKRVKSVIYENSKKMSDCLEVKIITK